MATVMVVDDVPMMRDMLKDIVLDCGHTIAGEASNGMEALELYRSCRPDLVTMDVTMPEMDGVTALKHILQFDANAKIIMCSAIGQQKVVLEAIMSGAKDYIIKPFRPEMVSSAIAQVISKGTTPTETILERTS
ncbi:response regulator [Xylanibacillus composti]|nr:response regulator [Xylanibacillus composti]